MDFINISDLQQYNWRRFLFVDNRTTSDALNYKLIFYKTSLFCAQFVMFQYLLLYKIITSGRMLLKLKS